MKYLTVVAIILMLGFGACGGGDSEKDFEVEPVDGGKSVKITKYLGSKWNVKIPSKIRGLSVTHIGNDAFREKNLTSVTIPHGIISIGNFAFYNNQLTGIIIPNSVASIGSGAFIDNPLTNITIPSSVTEMGVDRDHRGRFNGAFSDMSDFMVDVIVDNWGSRGDGIDLSYTYFKYKPGNWIFRDGKWSSGGATTQQSQKPSSKSPLIGKWAGDSVEVEFFKDGNFLIDNDKATWHDLEGGKLLIRSPYGEEMTWSYKIRGNKLTLDTHGNSLELQKVKESQKQNKSNTKSSNSETSINDFRHRTDANGVFIIEYIGTNRNVRIPDQINGTPVTTIGDNAFRNKGLTNVTIPASVQIIGTGTFVGNNLTTVTIPNSTHIYDNSFDQNVKVIRK